MRWAVLLLVALASCLAASQPLLQGRACWGRICFGKSKPKTFDFSLKDVDALVDKYDYEGQNESNPPSEEILWTDWSGGTATRGLRYRAWRIDGVNDDIDKTNTDFSVYLQVEVSSKDKLDVRFTGLFQKDGEDWYAIREGWALGNLYGRRTNFVLLIPGNAAQISYTFEGKWARGSK